MISKTTSYHTESLKKKLKKSVRTLRDYIFRGGTHSLPKDARDIFAKIETGTAGGVNYSDMIGPGDHVSIFFNHYEIITRCKWFSPNWHILDLGCGAGRFAAGMSAFLSPTARYVGIDVVPTLVDFCTTEISSRHKNFEFSCLKMANEYYDQYKGLDQDVVDRINWIDDVSEVCPDESMDACMALSLFTHLNDEDTEFYFSKIFRLLKKNGQFFITALLINPFVKDLLKSGRSRLGIEIDVSSDSHIYYPAADNPMRTVVYDEAWFVEKLAEYGFGHVNSILYGGWSGRELGVTFQDIILVHKCD